jgi:hypothetical protein
VDAALKGEPARALLETMATEDLDPIARQRLLTQAITRATTAVDGSIADYARERSQSLGEDHARVRAAASGSARVSVEPVLPPDIIGLYVQVPAGH